MQFYLDEKMRRQWRAEKAQNAMDNFLAVLAGQYIVKQSCFVESLDVVDYRDMFIRH